MKLGLFINEDIGKNVLQYILNSTNHEISFAISPNKVIQRLLKKANISQDPTPCDVIYSVHYFSIISNDTLKKAKYGGINVHPSPLPAYAGLYPYIHGILNEETMWASSLHLMESKIDSGKIIKQQHFPILPQWNSYELLGQCNIRSIEMLKEVLSLENEQQFINLLSQSLEQDLSQRTYFGKNKLPNTIIDTSEGLHSTLQKIKALSFYPYPYPHGEVILDHENKKYKILHASTEPLSSLKIKLDDQYIYLIEQV